METLPDWDLLAVVRNCCSSTTTSTATPTISTVELDPSPPQLSPLQEPCLTTTTGAFFQFGSSGLHELKDVCKPLVCTTASVASAAAVSSAVPTTGGVMHSNNNNSFQSLCSPVSSPSVISGENFIVSQQQSNMSQQQTQYQQQPSVLRPSQIQQQQQPNTSQQQTEFQKQFTRSIFQQLQVQQQQPHLSQQPTEFQQQTSISQQNMQFQQSSVFQQSQVQQPIISQQQTEFQQPSIFQQMQIQQQPNTSQQQTQFRGLVKPSHVIFGASSPSISGSGTSNVQRTKKRKILMKKVCHVPAEGLSSDMWAWRKYGQKPIKGSPYPRGYYRCSSSKGCLARKQVERNRSDPKMFIVTYTAEHNHPMPTHRNSLAGSTRQKPLSSTETPPQDQPCSSPSAASLSPLTEKSESKIEGDDLIKEEDDTTDMALSDLMLNDDFYVGFEQIDGGSDVSDCFSDQFSPSSEFPWLASSSATTAAGWS